MLVLGPGDDRLPDDADPARRHRLPDALRPALGADGVPQVLLSRSRDGGLLQVRLMASWPALAADEVRAAIASARFRLVLQTPTDPTAGQWHDGMPVADVIVARAVALDSVEVAIARRVATRGGAVVDVEVEYEIAGRWPVFPWIARTHGLSLRARVLAMMGPEPAPWSAVEDAFAGLTIDGFSWHPLEPGALPPAPDEALRAIARHAAPIVLRPVDGGWVAGPEIDAPVDVSLAVARSGTRRFGLRWSLSTWLAEQPEPGRYLVDVATPDPFTAAELQLVNDVALSPKGIAAIAVDVQTGGPTGVVQHTFAPGEASAARLPFVQPSFEAQALSWRARATVTTAAGPTIVATEFVPGGLMVRIDGKSLGLVPLSLAAEAVVFEHVAAIEVALGRGTYTLTAAAPEAWAMGRTPPATVAVTAVLTSGERVALGDLPVGPRGIVIGALELGIGESVVATLRPPDDLDARAAYLAVQVEGGPWRTLEAGGSLTWPVRQASRVQPPALRYRVRHVPRAQGGATSAMVDSPWRDAVGQDVRVEV